MPEEALAGVVGVGEIGAKVRITAITGIQYSRRDAAELWSDVARLFGTRVHFVYNETKGTRAIDGTHAFFDKYVRDNPKVVKALADHWQSLLEEMGEGGIIYHIAHSHGALLTTQAADMVSSYVRSRMVVRTFGALQNPYQRDFADIKNIVCSDDPVVRWLNWYEEERNVVRVPGVPNPKTASDNHGMRSVPYWGYLCNYESPLFRNQHQSRLGKFREWMASIFSFPKRA